MLFTKLMECGISSKMLNMIIALYNNVTSCVKLKNSITDEFPCEVGLRQGDCLSPILFSLFINDLTGKLSRKKHMTDIDILLYADDLAMLANSRDELQDKLNLLHLYCKDRNLHVNVNKSKIMVFNAIKDTRLFMYNDSKLDEVDSFKYLGMTINRRANLQYSQKISIQQALKAKASLECYLNNHKHMPVRDVFDLFDTLVKPIVLFNSEIWGININKELEQFHLSFMKRILGVKKSTNNNMQRQGDILYIYAFTYELLNIGLKSRLHQSIDIFTLFIISVLLLYEYGFDDVWEANADFIKQYEQRLKDTFQQKCRSEIANSNRCSLYNHLHREFTTANYLNKVQIRTNRRALTKLRLSSHRLLIERGRWLKIKYTSP